MNTCVSDSRGAGRPAARQQVRLRASGTVLGVLLASLPALANASSEQDRATVAALDTQYQDAVRRNDVAVMDRILADDFVLVTGLGKTYHKNDLLDQARSREVRYEHQDEIEKTQTVRVWGDTAVVTALLWIKGTTSTGDALDYKLWFSDTYVRTPDGWRYVFGQAAQRIPSGT